MRKSFKIFGSLNIMSKSETMHPVCRLSQKGWLIDQNKTKSKNLIPVILNRAQYLVTQ